jgi:hypothetical protein
MTVVAVMLLIQQVAFAKVLGKDTDLVLKTSLSGFAASEVFDQEVFRKSEYGTNSEIPNLNVTIESYIYPVEKFGIGLGIYNSVISFPTDKTTAIAINYYIATKFKLFSSKAGTSYVYHLFNLGFSTAIEDRTEMIKDVKGTFKQHGGYFYGLGLGLNLKQVLFELMITQSKYKYTGSYYSDIDERTDETTNITSNITMYTIALTMGYRFSL